MIGFQREKRQIHNYGQTLQYLSVNKSWKKQAENQEGYSELEQYHQPTWLGWHDRTLHSTAAEYIYFSSVQGPERPHSGSKPSFSKFKRIQIIQKV